MPKSPEAKFEQLARILKCKPENVVTTVKILARDHREMCTRLQKCCHRHRLGLGGEQTDKLVVAEVIRLLKITRQRRAGT